MSAPDELRAIAPEDPATRAIRLRNRRNRSIALGLALFAFVLIFYVLTLVKMGPAVFNRPI